MFLLKSWQTILYIYPGCRFIAVFSIWITALIQIQTGLKILINLKCFHRDTIIIISFILFLSRLLLNCIIGKTGKVEFENKL